MNNEQELKKSIGKRITRIREQMNLTKEALAKELKMSGQYLGVVEKGEGALSYERIKRLCDISGCSSDYILFGKSTKNDGINNELAYMLKDFSDSQIEETCEIIKNIAIFMKNSN